MCLCTEVRLEPTIIIVINYVVICYTILPIRKDFTQFALQLEEMSSEVKDLLSFGNTQIFIHKKMWSEINPIPDGGFDQR